MLKIFPQRAVHNSCSDTKIEKTFDWADPQIKAAETTFLVLLIIMCQFLLSCMQLEMKVWKKSILIALKHEQMTF